MKDFAKSRLFLTFLSLVMTFLISSSTPHSAVGSETPWRPLATERNDLVLSISPEFLIPVFPYDQPYRAYVLCREPGSILACEKATMPTRQLTIEKARDQFTKDPTPLRVGFALPVCAESGQQPCIQEIRVGKGSDPLKFDGYIGETWPEAELQEFMPIAGQHSVWRTEPDALGAIQRYLFTSNVRISWNKSKAMSYETLSIQVIPIKTLDIENLPVYSDLIQRYPTAIHGPNRVYRVGTRACIDPVWVDARECNVRVPFLPETNVQVSLQTAPTLSGWVTGRASDVDVRRETGTAPTDTWVIRGNAISVPTVAVKVAKEKLKLSGRGYISFTDKSVDEFPKWREAIEVSSNDMASGQASVWFLTISDPWMMPNLPSSTKTMGCLAKNSGVDGVITTNAMTYEGEVPRFREGTFIYRIGGLHKNSEARTEFGFYQMQLGVDFAKCLYGLSTVPDQALVTIVNDDETPRSLTVSLKSRNSANMVSLSVGGITFSINDVKVRFESKEQLSNPIKCNRTKKLNSVENNLKRCPKGFVTP